MTVPSPVTCLVVDDEAPLRQILVRLLKTQGHVCREAGAGREQQANRDPTREAQEHQSQSCPHWTPGAAAWEWAQTAAPAQ